VSHSEIAKKFTKTRYFSILRSFKVIDVGTPGKLVSSACYDKHQVCAYLQPFSCKGSQFLLSTFPDNIIFAVLDV